MGKLLKRIGRVLQHPQVLKTKLMYGMHADVSYYFLTLKDFYSNINTYIDVGFNDGCFIEASNYFFPNVKNIGFEPFKERYDYCLNRLRNSKLYNIALWNKNEKRVFHENRIFDGISSFKVRTKKHRDTFNVPFNEVNKEIEAKRFDSLNIKIKRPCFLKIDVEGSEYEVLEGFGDRLKEVDVILIEYMFANFYEKQRNLSDIMRLLEKYDFKQFIQIANQINEDGIIYCDLMFFINIESKSKANK